MSIFHFLPGILWLDVLDKITDQCTTILGWKLPCSLVTFCIWMFLLNEVRYQAVRIVKVINIAYYKPNKPIILKYYSQWPIRLLICSMICCISYYCTFQFPKDFPYLQQMKEIIVNEKYNQNVHDVTVASTKNKKNGDEVILMAHIFVQRFLLQIEGIVWILGTLLRLKRKRFLKLIILISCLKPLGSFFVSKCGNYSLWLFIGHTLLRIFDLIPQGYNGPPTCIGTVGCFAAIVVSTIYWRKFGTIEILLTIITAVSAEILWMNTRTKVQQDKQSRQQQSKLSITDRIWIFFAGFVVPDDDDDDDKDKKHEDLKPSSASNNNDKSKIPSKDTSSQVVTYTKPSLYSWLAIVVYWAAVGIQLDGYDIFTL